MNTKNNLKPLIKDIVACLLKTEQRFLVVWKKMELKDKKIMVEKLEEIVYCWLMRNKL